MLHQIHNAALLMEQIAMLVNSMLQTSCVTESPHSYIKQKGKSAEMGFFPTGKNDLSYTSFIFIHLGFIPYKYHMLSMGKTNGNAVISC